MHSPEEKTHPSPRYTLLGGVTSPTAAMAGLLAQARGRAPALLRLAMWVTVGIACFAGGLAYVALHNVAVMRFLRVIWQGIQVYDSWEFSHKAVDARTGFLVPIQETCNSGFHTDHWSFEQCTPELLDAAVSTLARRVRVESGVPRVPEGALTTVSRVSSTLPLEEAEGTPMKRTVTKKQKKKKARGLGETSDDVPRGAESAGEQQPGTEAQLGASQERGVDAEERVMGLVKGSHQDSDLFGGTRPEGGEGGVADLVADLATAAADVVDRVTAAVAAKELEEEDKAAAELAANSRDVDPNATSSVPAATSATRTNALKGSRESKESSTPGLEAAVNAAEQAFKEVAQDMAADDVASESTADSAADPTSAAVKEASSEQREQAEAEAQEERGTSAASSGTEVVSEAQEVDTSGEQALDASAGSAEEGSNSAEESAAVSATSVPAVMGPAAPASFPGTPPAPTRYPLASERPAHGLLSNFSACRMAHPEDKAACPVEWVTHITTCNPHANRLARAVAATGTPLAVVGLGTFWKKRWGYRMRLLHDHLLTLPDDKLVLVTDSEDVLPVPETTPEIIAERYTQLVDLYKGPRVFFAAEIVCYPRPQLWFGFPDPVTIPGGKGWSPFRCLNAGIMVGPAGLVRRMIELTYQKDCHDDQLLYSLAYQDPIVWWVDPVTSEYRVAATSTSPEGSIPAEAERLIGLDNWNILALSMYGVEEESYKVEEGGRHLNLTLINSTPLVLHQSGDKSESSLLEKLAKQFGYYKWRKP